MNNRRGYGVNSTVNYQCLDGFVRSSGFKVGLCHSKNSIVGDIPTCEGEILNRPCLASTLITINDQKTT